MPIYRVVATDGVEIGGEVKPLNMSVTLSEEEAKPFLEANQIEFVKNEGDAEPTGEQSAGEQSTGEQKPAEEKKEEPKAPEATSPAAATTGEQPKNDGKWNHSMDEKPQTMQRA